MAFFASYWLWGLNVATAVLVVLTLIATGVLWLNQGKLPMLPLLTAGLVALFGGLTLWFDDPRFIKMKPTVVQVALGLLLIVSGSFRRPLLSVMLGGSFDLEPQHWRRLSLRYGLFFLAMAGLNEYIWRNFSTDVWVNFKFFGLTGLTVLFSLTQVAFLMRHSRNQTP